MNLIMQEKVSILIPTLNSGINLRGALSSIREDPYNNVEVIISDSGSTDDTLEIAKEFGAKVLNIDGRLLKARVSGIEEASGGIIFLVDSDQVLTKGIIGRSVETMSREGYDMIVLEEKLLGVDSFLARSWQKEKEVILSNIALYLNPLNGSILPRIFRAEILKKAVTFIPQNIIGWLRHPDHQIIYFECYNLSRNIGYIPGGLETIERYNPVDIIKTYYLHGKDAKRLSKYGRYEKLVKSKYSSKLLLVTDSKFGFQGLMGLGLKSLSFSLGYTVQSLVAWK